MYLYVDSFEGLSRDEVLQKTFDERLTPEQQANARRAAEAKGISLMDLLREVANEYDAAMADPVRREEWLRRSQEMDDKQAMPFGPDPRLAAERDTDEDEEDA